MASNPLVHRMLKEMLELGKTPEEVCRDCPELLPEVRQRWRQFQLIDAQVRTLLPGLATRPEAGAAAPPARAPAPPAAFGRYQVRGSLGAGGFGAVYLGHDTQLDRPVAIKVLRGGANPAQAEGEPVEQRLDGHLAPQRTVGGAVHDPHAAVAKHRLDLVPGNARQVARSRHGRDRIGTLACAEPRKQRPDLRVEELEVLPALADFGEQLGAVAAHLLRRLAQFEHLLEHLVHLRVIGHRRCLFKLAARPRARRPGSAG